VYTLDLATMSTHNRVSSTNKASLGCIICVARPKPSFFRAPGVKEEIKYPIVVRESFIICIY
jgi:hypothetical protein